MDKDFIMPVMATERGSVSYTVTHNDLLDFARQIVERTKQMSDAERAEIPASTKDAYCTRKEVMALLRRCDSTMTKWARSGYLVPVRIGGKFLYKKADVERVMGLNHR